jgi:hypothetical protein
MVGSLFGIDYRKQKSTSVSGFIWCFVRRKRSARHSYVVRIYSMVHYVYKKNFLLQIQLFLYKVVIQLANAESANAESANAESANAESPNAKSSNAENQRMSNQPMPKIIQCWIIQCQIFNVETSLNVECWK